ncbi:MAG: hypothetical protein HYS27_22500 [Deltaproteobacteria bacterium]|nr:hypothetical protein [Deltaproteobacteria bacterium]
MPLIAPDPPQKRERPPWRGLVVGLLAAIVFIVGLAVTAYATRDSAGPVRPPALDAGGDAEAAALDAGAMPPDAGVRADAVEVATAEPEPDAGAFGPVGPPVDLAELAATAQPLVQRCLAEALRFDPSFGGRVRLRVEVNGRTLLVQPPAGASPVFARCLGAERARLEGAPTRAAAELTVVLDGLRTTATIIDSEVVE